MAHFQSQLAQTQDLDILLLMDTSDLNEEAKTKILTDVSALVWERFLAERLPQLLSQRQMDDFAVLVAGDATFVQIQEYLLSNISNLQELLFEFAQIIKLEFLLTHYKRMIDILQDDYEADVDSELKQKIDTQLKKYKAAVNYLVDAQWASLQKLFATEQ